MNTLKGTSTLLILKWVAKIKEEIEKKGLYSHKVNNNVVGMEASTIFALCTLQDIVSADLEEYGYPNSKINYSTDMANINLNKKAVNEYLDRILVLIDETVKTSF